MELLNTRGIAWAVRREEKDEDEQVAVVKWDKKFAVIKAKRCMDVIQAINSEGLSNVLDELGQIRRLIGVKDLTEERTFEKVVQKFEGIAGKENVITYCLD